MIKRYTRGFLGMEKCNDGKYVLHSENESQNERLSKDNAYLFSKLKKTYTTISVLAIALIVSTAVNLMILILG